MEIYYKIHKKLNKKRKNKSNDIFEVISDIKIKSFNEYVKDKKPDKNTIIKNTPSNGNKISNNISINININYNNININNTDKKSNKQCNIEMNNKINKENPLNNCTNGEFIEDRDEYNILKETFSKDRFSFRPVSNDNNQAITNFQQYNSIVNNSSINENNINNSERLSLDKKDFINRNVTNSNILNDYINKNNTNFNRKRENIKLVNNEISKIQKLKKIIKNKPTSKLLKDGNILNKSAELRYKK